MNATLVKRADDIVALNQLIAESGGEINSIIENWLTEVETSLSTKVDHYKFIQDQLDVQMESLKTEAAQLSSAAKTLERIKENLKDRIKFTMRKLDVAELKGTKYRYKLSASKPRLVIDAEKIPDALKIVVTEKVPDKERIRILMETGETVPGAQFEQGYTLNTYVTKGE